MGKKQSSPNFVEERLDRVLATSIWRDIHHNAEVVSSDHNAIFLDLSAVIIPRHKFFRFENSWIAEPDCKEVVRRGWMDITTENIQQKIAFAGRASKMRRFSQAQIENGD